MEARRLLENRRENGEMGCVRGRNWENTKLLFGVDRYAAQYICTTIDSQSNSASYALKNLSSNYFSIWKKIMITPPFFLCVCGLVERENELNRMLINEGA